VRRTPQLRLYVEGGGDSDALHTMLRQAFAALFERACVQRKPRVVACGGRQQALDDYAVAVAQRPEVERAFLLVDSEDPVAEGDTRVAHLERRDGWKPPAGVEENSVFLMVQCMETWLLADVESLRAVFHNHFRDDRIPQWPKLEEVPKLRVLDAIRRATDGRYEKRRVLSGTGASGRSAPGGCLPGSPRIPRGDEGIELNAARAAARRNRAAAAGDIDLRGTTEIQKGAVPA
jgi:hypothetical protein